MKDVTAEAAPVADIWPYVDDLEPITCGITSIGDVHRVYRDAHDRFDQILIDVDRSSTFLVIIVDRERSAVIGHHVLGLSEKYGL